MPPDYLPVPTAAEIAAANLPAFRIASRETHGRLKSFVLAPFLPILLRIAVELIGPWLIEWVKSRRGQGPPALTALDAMARGLNRDMLPEVQHGLFRAAKGDTGE